MRRDLAADIGADTSTADVTVAGASWRVHIFGIVVVGRDAFVQVALVGPTNRTATVRIAARVVKGVTGRQLLDAICGWLASGDTGDHGYLEVAGSGSCPRAVAEGVSGR